MNLLLTSNGISNKSLHDALVDLLGKPISESSALFVPTGIYPFLGGGRMAWNAMLGKLGSPYCQLGWKSLGLLELTALTSIDKNAWVPEIEQTDALLVWGGDPLYLSYWMQQSGLTDLLPSLRRESVYVGVSAGSIMASSLFGETYSHPRTSSGTALTSEEILVNTPQGEVTKTFITAKGAGMVDFALIPHLDHVNHPESSLDNAEKWAAKLPVPVYAIDDETGIKVTDGKVTVVSEGHWKLFTP